MSDGYFRDIPSAPRTATHDVQGREDLMGTGTGKPLGILKDAHVTYDAPATGPRVVGIDLSLTGTGIANSAGRVITIGSRGKADATLGQRRSRLSRLCHEITSDVLIGQEWRPTLVVVEQPAFSRQNGHMHDRSGLWWLVVDRLHVLGIDVVEVSPTGRAKYATGKGNASKDTVLAAVVRRYPDIEVSNNNEADAVVLMAMGVRSLGYSFEDSLPQTHLAAMDAVRWPVLT